jgi:hypothetical protein
MPYKRKNCWQKQTQKYTLQPQTIYATDKNCKQKVGIQLNIITLSDLPRKLVASGI